MDSVYKLIKTEKLCHIATAMAFFALLGPVSAQGAGSDNSESASAQRRFDEFLNTQISAPTHKQSDVSTQKQSGLVTTSHYPQPSPERLQSWVDQFFETDELWRFKDRKTFEAILDSTVTDLSLREELKALYKDTISSDEFIKTVAHYEMDGPGGYVFVPKQLREKVPRQLLQSVYSSQFETYHSLPLLSIRTPNLRGIGEFFSIHHIPSTAQTAALKNIVQLNGEHFLLITPHIWSLFPEGVRRNFIKNEIDLGSEEKGVKARLVIHRHDNLSEIAKKYAGERDPRPIERYLRLALGKSESVEIPLEKIMHPFIRKMIDTYPACHGPNCFNSGLNVNRGHAYRLENVVDEPSLMNEVYSKYRFVNANEPLQAGDLLAYVDAKGRVVHTASYVSDDVDRGLVFTKNGLNKFNPYIFQEISSMESIYFPDGQYQLMVFRTPKASEAPISNNPMNFSKRIFYRQHLPSPTLRFDDLDDCFLPSLNSKLEKVVAPRNPGK